MIEIIKKKIYFRYLMNLIFTLFYISSFSCFYQTKKNHFIIFSNINQTVLNTELIDVNDKTDLFQDKYKIIYCDNIENFLLKLNIYAKNITYPLVN
jgi:hypothetical protein